MTRTILRACTCVALWLAIGLMTTIAVSWGLAAFMPQRNWRARYVDGWSLHEPRGAMLIEQHSALGSTRRTWEWQTALWFKPAIDAQRIWDSRIQFDSTQYPLGWPRWGNAEHARNWFLVHRFQASDSQASTRPLFQRPDFQVSPASPYQQVGCEHAVGWPVLALWYQIAVDPTTRALEVTRGIPLQRSGRTGVIPTLHTIRAIPYLPIWPGLVINSFFWGTAAFLLLTASRAVRRARRHRRGLCITCAYDLKGDIGPGCPECGWNRPPSPETQVPT